MSTVRIAEESMLVEVSIEPRLTADGARILLVTTISDRTGTEWNARVALANVVRDPADVVEPTVLAPASREDIFGVPTPSRSDREAKERSRSRDRNRMWELGNDHAEVRR